MTTDEILRRWSASRGEPAWLASRRSDALARLSGLYEDGLAELRRALDEETGRLLPVAPELIAQGVEALPLEEAASRGDAPSWWPDAGTTTLDAIVEAFWTGGYFIRVPHGVKAELPLHVAAGLKRFGRVEKSVVLLEEESSLELVEGCTELGGGEGGRWSVVDVRVGPRASLEAASVQAWSGGVVSRALKRAYVAGEGRLEWTDANLWAARVEKTIEARLEGGARADILCGGYAGAGESQRLVVLALPPGRAQVRILAAGEVEGLGGVCEHWAGGEAASLHGFFEPLARRLPLEFSVEFTRLLAAVL